MNAPFSLFRLIGAHRGLLPAFLLGAAMCDSPAQSGLAIDNLAVEENGAFTFEGIRFSLVAFGMAWERSAQKDAIPADGYPETSGTAWAVSETLAVRNTDVPLEIRQQIAADGSGGFTVEYEVSFPSPGGLAMKDLALEVTLPVRDAQGREILLDGTAHVLPPEPDTMVVLPTIRAASLQLPAPEGTLLIEPDMPMPVRVEGLRAWKHPVQAYSVRIQFPLAGGILKTSSLRLRVSHSPTR